VACSRNPNEAQPELAQYELAGGVAAALVLFSLSFGVQVLGDYSDLFPQAFFALTLVQLLFTLTSSLFAEVDASNRANTRVITLGLTKQQENKVGLLLVERTLCQPEELENLTQDNELGRSQRVVCYLGLAIVNCLRASTITAALLLLNTSQSRSFISITSLNVPDFSIYFMCLGSILLVATLCELWRKSM